MRRMQQMAGQMGMFNPMAIQFGAYGAYAQAVSVDAARVERGRGLLLGGTLPRNPNVVVIIGHIPNAGNISIPYLFIH